MKREDPVRLKLRAERERANLWLDILCKGIGAVFADLRYAPEDLRPIIDKVNGELMAAVEAAEAAEEAYRPYWARRRTIIRPKSAKKKKTVAA